MKILFTGFEPFDGDSINPSYEAIKQLETIALPNIEILTIEVPVVLGASIRCVTDCIRTVQPDAVVTLGQAGGSPMITPERVAINLDDYRIADNAGNQPIDTRIITDAPDAYFSTLPIKAMVANMHSKNIPASISNSAGTFVCNHLFFGVQHFIVTNQLPIRHGFVHIPYLPSQTLENGQPSMPLSLIVDGLCAIAEAIYEYTDDIKVTGGKIY